MSLSKSPEIRDKEYRHGLVAAQIDIDLPLQLKALRNQRGWSQPELAQRTGMKQPRFPLMEKPGARFTIETLRRLAEAFDVALIVRFAPFSELLEWSEGFNPDKFRVPAFEEEFEGLQHQVRNKNCTSAERLAQIVEQTEAMRGAQRGFASPASPGLTNSSVMRLARNTGFANQRSTKGCASAKVGGEGRDAYIGQLAPEAQGAKGQLSGSGPQ